MTDVMDKVEGEIGVLIEACDAVLLKEKMHDERDQLAMERSSLIAEIEKLKADRLHFYNQAENARVILKLLQDELSWAKGSLATITREVQEAEKVARAYTTWR